MARPPVILKDFYYLDHFFEMVEFLKRHYPDLESAPEGEVLRRFEILDRDEQAMMVRISNRKGKIFERKALGYDEIRDHELSLNRLEVAGMVRRLDESDFKEFTEGLTKGRIMEFLKVLGREIRGCSSLSKPKLVERVRELCTFEEFREAGILDRFVVQEKVDELSFLNFLFFGRLSEGMQAFTMRDLGVMRTSQSRSFKPRYSGLELAKAAYFHARLGREIREGEGKVLVEIARKVEEWPEEGKERNLVRLGAQLEKQGFLGEALEVFQQAGIHPARERVCRILFSRGERAGVRNLLREIVADPLTDEELLFAEDFYRLKYQGKTMGTLTGMLRDAPVIRIDEAYKGHSEEAAIRYFRKEGKETALAENHFWMTLFGILFWDELLAETPNEFDSRATGLLDGTFARVRKNEIEAKLALIGSPPAVSLVRDTFACHFGEPNGFFRWQRDDEDLLIRFLSEAPPEAVVAALLRIVDDPETNRRGYPDLIQFDHDGVRFIEIKAEGDQIQRHQLAQIKALQSCGFEVGVVRIEWIADPRQEYVVVDLETTGGQAEFHRITEIGAVRIRNGELVETFESLVDPGRRIPSKIVELTGITNEMVEGQPTFAEVADQFREFVGESIFVAHNAKFDYGFVRREFARMGVEFQRPVLCTVVSMRRYFPGRKSYSLKNLCREFGIDLQGHHRALCDAKATAGLLKLINEKRSSV